MTTDDPKLYSTRITKAPPPISPVRGSSYSYSPPKKSIYDNPVTESDYVRCITDGIIKIHHLAALVCDLSPPENTGANTSDSKLYVSNMHNSGNPLGLICNKLVLAIKTGKLPIISTGYVAGDYWFLLSLTKAVEWLEKQPGIVISERLKDYIAEHFENKKNKKQAATKNLPKSTYMERIAEATQLGINYTRDEDREWAKENGFSVVSVDRRRKEVLPAPQQKGGRRKIEKSAD